MQQAIKPILIFNFDIDIYEEEISMKGYCNVEIQLPDYSKYKATFHDIIRLGQDLETESYIAEEGLIVVKDVNRENMERAVYELWLDGYFEKIKPI